MKTTLFVYECDVCQTEHPSRSKNPAESVHAAREDGWLIYSHTSVCPDCRED